MIFIIEGKYNLSAIMVMAHKFKEGFRSFSAALKKVWKMAQDAMFSFNHSKMMSDNNKSADLSGWTKFS
jgi:hypothetical protein